jgi:hypothetical protein
MTVHHAKECRDGTPTWVGAECGEINTYTKTLTVSDDWAMVTCEACLKHRPNEGLALPCPWCNTLPKMQEIESALLGVSYWLACINCDCVVRPHTLSFPSRYRAIEVWNGPSRKEAAERARMQQSIDALTKDLSAANDKNLAKAREVDMLERGLGAIKLEAEKQATRIFRLAEENRQLRESVKGLQRENMELLEKQLKAQRLESGEVITENRMRNEIRALIDEEFKKRETMTCPPDPRPMRVVTIHIDGNMWTERALKNFAHQLNQHINGKDA